RDAPFGAEEDEQRPVRLRRFALGGGDVGAPAQTAGRGCAGIGARRRGDQDATGQDDGGGERLHPLTPPWVSPPTRWRSSAKKSAITGRDTRMAPAAKCPHSV